MPGLLRNSPRTTLLAGLSVLLAILLASSCTTKPKNTPPTAHLVVSPDIGVVGEEVVFDAGGSSDPDEETRFLQMRWDLNGDGTWDTLFGTIPKRTHIYHAPGERTVRVEVRDSHGATSIAAQDYVVGYPAQASLTVGPELGTVDSIYTFDASASTVAGQNPELLQLRWDFQGDGVWDVEWSSGLVRTYQFQEPGSYQARVMVRTVEGLTDSAAAAFTVYSADAHPQALFTVAPDSGTIATTFQFDAGASHDAQDPASVLEVRWDWEGDGLFDTVWTIVKTAQHSYSTPGIYSPILQVKDTDGFMSIAQEMVVVIDTPPVAVFTVTPDSGTVATDFLFNATTSSDLEAPEDLQLRWDWTSDGEWNIAWSTNRTAQHRYPAVGIYRVTLEVRDLAGQTARQEQNVTVYNTPPQVVLSAPVTHGLLTTPFEFTAACADLEDDNHTLEVRWDLHGAGTWDIDWGTQHIVQHQYAELGTYQVRVEVRDSHGAQAETSLEIIVSPEADWVFHTNAGAEILASPAVGDDGKIFLTATDGLLYAVAPNGALAWSYDSGSPIRGSPAVGDDGTIYFGNDAGQLHALTPNGSLIWTYQADGGIDGSPALAQDGSIYFTRLHHEMLALDPDGSLKWSIEHVYMGGSHRSPSIAPDGTIFIGNNGHQQYYAIHPDGTLSFHVDAGGWGGSIEAAVGSDNSFYMHSSTYFSHILPDGFSRRIGTNYQNYATPVILPDERVLTARSTGGQYGELMLFPRDTARGQYPDIYKFSVVPGRICGSPLLAADGSIFVVNQEGWLFKLDATGLEQWRYRFGDGSAATSPAIGADGTIYVVSRTGEVHALPGGAGGLADTPWPKFRANPRNTGRR